MKFNFSKEKWCVNRIEREKKIEVFEEVFECVEVCMNWSCWRKKSIEIGLAQHKKPSTLNAVEAEEQKELYKVRDTIELFWTTTGRSWDWLFPFVRFIFFTTLQIVSASVIYVDVNVCSGINWSDLHLCFFVIMIYGVGFWFLFPFALKIARFKAPAQSIVLRISFVLCVRRSRLWRTTKDRFA